MPLKSAPPRPPVAVAMSGGVDSSVAAALLLEAGEEIFGLTMDLFPPAAGECGAGGSRSCCGRATRADANRVAARLGIAHYVVDLRREFERAVVSEFSSAYAAGRTPNPCVLCNRLIKFEALWRRARRLNAGALATGHYARVASDPASGRRLLLRAVDRDKDQSYFLYALTQAELGRTLFPLGETTKARVRAKARELGLAVAAKPESQEICFVPDRDYARFLRARVPEAFRPGPIVDPAGRPIGRHGGIAGFTVGQRKGLGIASFRPLYVAAIDAAANTVVAAPAEDLTSRRLEAFGLNWIAVERLAAPLAVEARIRSRHPAARATVEPAGEDRVVVEFGQPQRAVAPGQAVVFYDGDVVVGGGTIA